MVDKTELKALILSSIGTCGETLREQQYLLQGSN